MTNFEAQAVIKIHPSGESFSFKIFKAEQVDKLIEMLRILEQAAKDEQALRLQESQQADEENNNV